MRNALGLALLILMTSCAAKPMHVNAGPCVVADGQAGTNLQVRVRQTNATNAMPPMPMYIPGSTNSGSTEAPFVDIKYAIAIRNQSDEPVTVRHITLFLGHSRYLSSERTTRNYDKPIAPGATEQVDFWIEAKEPGAEMVAFAPPNVLATIEFEGTQGKRTESFSCGVNGERPTPR